MTRISEEEIAWVESAWQEAIGEGTMLAERSHNLITALREAYAEIDGMITGEHR